MGQINTVADWAKMVLEIWSERMDTLGIHDAAVHARSFQHTVYTAAGGDATKVMFMFEYVLKFTDMGVGKGVSFANRGQNTIRRQKPWFTKTFLLEVKKLANMLAVHYAHEGILWVKETIEDK